MSRSRRWLTIILLLLAGCSKTEFLYRNADWFIERWVDNLVSLSDEQRSVWRVSLEQALAQHREVELPAVVEFLSVLEQRAKVPITEPDVQCLVDQAQQLFRRHTRLAAGTAALLLEKLSPQQLDDLERRFGERNAEFRKEYLVRDKEERAVRREQRIIKRIERWTGRLEPFQRDLVRNASRDMPELAGPWIHYRQGRQQALLRMLRANTEQESLRRFLAAWWVDFAGMPDELRRATHATRLESENMLSRLSFTLTPEQREKLVERVGELRTGLEGSLKPGALRTASTEGNRIYEGVGGVNIGCPTH